MGRPMSLWYNLSLASKFKVTYGTIGCANWLTPSLHQIGAALYVPKADAIDAALFDDPKVEILRPFISEDAGMDYIQSRKTI